MNETTNVLETVMRISRSMKRNHPRMKGGEHRHRGGFRIIRVLAKEGPMPSKDLAEKLDIRPSSLSEALDRLQEKELITRNTDESDKRKVIVSLTDKAVDRMNKRRENKDEYQTLLASAISEEEQAEFVRIGNKIIDAIKNANKED